MMITPRNPPVWPNLNSWNISKPSSVGGSNEEEREQETVAKQRTTNPWTAVKENPFQIAKNALRRKVTPHGQFSGIGGEERGSPVG